MDNNQINPEKKISSSEEMEKVFSEKNDQGIEKHEKISDEEMEIIKEELRREVDALDTDPEMKKEAQEKAKKIGSFSAHEIMENLLEISNERGIVFAVNVANKMNDPFILDTFRDLLVRKGHIKKP